MIQKLIHGYFPEFQSGVESVIHILICVFICSKDAPIILGRFFYFYSWVQAERNLGGYYTMVWFNKNHRAICITISYTVFPTGIYQNAF